MPTYQIYTPEKPITYARKWVKGRCLSRNLKSIQSARAKAWKIIHDNPEYTKLIIMSDGYIKGHVLSRTELYCIWSVYTFGKSDNYYLFENGEISKEGLTFTLRK